MIGVLSSLYLCAKKTVIAIFFAIVFLRVSGEMITFALWKRKRMLMKRYLFFYFGALCALNGASQIIEESVSSDEVRMMDSIAQSGTVVSQSTDLARYGYCNRRAIVEAQPEYGDAMSQLEELKKQYEVEVEYNETDFRRQFQEYLYGQKDFPQAILLKRQRDLQVAMEKGIAFRQEADSLLRQARMDLVRPIEVRVDAAISAVASERGYDYVVDTDKGAFLYLNPRLSEDITLYVEEKLR